MLTQPIKKVVIVNGTADMLEVVDKTLDAGHYDIVFVESSENAYTQIKRVLPGLVILCMHFDDADSFRVLSMLKLDQDTRDIPVLTYTTEYDSPEREYQAAPADEDRTFELPALRMN